MLICLPVSTVCLLILVCQLLLLNPQVKRFYDGFWTGFWNGITLNVPR
ncbi:hypothetical protein ELBI_104 [Anabaena phage Elbi]|nr:hypothetical protein ELBI_104 [Anabaena phage Elbi]